jgi:hypothetical protein
VASDLDGVRAAVAGLPDAELLKITSVDCGKHPTPTFLCAREELVRRGLLAPESQQFQTEPLNPPKPSPKPSIWMRWTYPSISSEATALRAARQGAVAAWATAGVTAIWVVLAPTGEAFAKYGVTKLNLIDVVLSLGIGIGIWRGSFVFAVIGMLFFLTDRILVWTMTGHAPGGLAALMFIGFMNGVRGSYTLRRWRKGLEPLGPPPADIPS